ARKDAGGLAPPRRLLLAEPSGTAGVAEGADEVRGAAALVVAVDDVVVHEQGGVQKLDRDGELDGGFVIRVLELRVARQQQSRAHALAARDGRAHLVPELGVVGGVTRRARGSAAHEVVQAGLHLAERSGGAGFGGHAARAFWNRSSSSTCSTIHGLNAHGVVRADAASSSGCTQTCSITSVGDGCSSEAMRAV